jgi:hypothetical protein
MTIGTVYSAAKKDLQSLAQWTQDQLVTLASAIATGWNVQHDGEGHHTDVTATRVRTGSLGLNGIYQINLGNQTSIAPLVIPAKVTVIDIVTGGATVDLYGIQQDGAQFGDILAISCYFGSSNLQVNGLANSTIGPGTTPIGTEIVWDFLFHAVSPLVLSVSSFRSPLLLMYLPRRGSQQASAWSVLRGIT